MENFILLGLRVALKIASGLQQSARDLILFLFLDQKRNICVNSVFYDFAIIYFSTHIGDIDRSDIIY